jgi:hypothetical protein
MASRRRSRKSKIHRVRKSKRNQKGGILGFFSKMLATEYTLELSPLYVGVTQVDLNDRKVIISNATGDYILNLLNDKQLGTIKESRQFDKRELGGKYTINVLSCNGDGKTCQIKLTR